MTVDPAVIPGLLLLAAEFAALAVVGFVVARVALRQDDDRVALAQGLVIGIALWGLITNFVLYAVPGLAGAAVGWGLTLILGTVLAWRARRAISLRPRVAAAFAGCLPGALLASARQPAVAGEPGPDASPGVGGVDPGGRISAGVALESGHGGALSPRGRSAGRVADAAGWTRPGVRAGAAGRLRVDEPGARGGDGAAAARVVEGRAGHRAAAADRRGLDVDEPGRRHSAGSGPGGAAGGRDLARHWRISTGRPRGQPGALEPTALHDIWTPAFTVGYALAFVVLERAARPERLSWLGTLTLGVLVGFIGILATSLVPVVVVLWAALAAVHVMRTRCAQAAVRSGAGLALAGLLLLGGGGAFTGILDVAPPSGPELAWDLNPRHWEALGTFEARAGGVGLLGLGPIVVAGIAVILARRDRLVVTLAAGTGLLLLAWLVLSFPPAPWVLSRLAGHARNLALVALLLALAARLSVLGPVRWHYALAALVVGLIAWPTVVGPVRGLGQAVGSGVQLANAGWVERESLDQKMAESTQRFQLPTMSERLASYIRDQPPLDLMRDHTPVDTRVFTPEWPYWAASLATGRPNNAGFAGLGHLIYYTGPEYLDALNYLEPAAIQRLRIEYVHATDTWAAGLPARARRWLADPDFFRLLMRDGDEALYHVRPAFRNLEVAPHPESFEALRSVPPSMVVYLAPQLGWLHRLRVASVLSHARLTGAIDTQPLHLMTPTPWTVEPLGERVPDLVVLPASVEPSMFPSVEWQLVWTDAADGIAVYADTRGVKALP